MQLNPMHLKIAGLLAGRLFRIPEYQRAYAWGTKQRSDLFSDIVDVYRSGREHFMATVVALARKTISIGVDEFHTVELVDGQQRITTIVILLKAIEKALPSATDEEKRAKRDLYDLLVKRDDHSLILLQTNHDSSTIFTKYLRSGFIDEGAALTASDLNLVNAAHECENFVNMWARDKTLIELISTIRNRLSVIYHELADEATVYRVFEVLNSRGLDVKWIDKLKSQLMALIFEHADIGARDDAVREMQSIWQDVYRKLGVRVDLGDEALRFAGTWALAARPNRIISQEDASTALTKRAGIALKSILQVGHELKDVVLAAHKLDRNVRLRAVTRVAHARFLATAIILRSFDSKTEAELLGIWERATFRIFGLGGADTRHKIGDYVRLAYSVYANKMPAADIRRELVKLGTDYGIDQIISGGDYWDECYDGWTEELRYLLFRYDEYLTEMGGGKLNSGEWNKIWALDASKSIEHIMPQSSGENYIHHLGNLTMLPPNINSALRDLPPENKAAAYVDCGLKATAAVGRAIQGGLKWDEAAVLARASEIEKFVRQEWAD